MDKIAITIPGQPQGKGRPRVCMRGNHAHAYTPERTADYERQIRCAYAGKPMLAGAVHIDVQAYYGIPRSWSKSKRESALKDYIQPQIKPDLDNVVKVVCDALNGLAYKDDTQVVSITAGKHYSEVPRVEAELWEVRI